MQRQLETPRKPGQCLLLINDGLLEVIDDDYQDAGREATWLHNLAFVLTDNSINIGMDAATSLSDHRRNRGRRQPHICQQR